MFGIGLVEVFLVLVVALFAIGPDRIPEAASALAKGVKSIRQFINELKRSVHDHPLADVQTDLFAEPEIFPADNDMEQAPKKGRKL